jgi:regulator of sigma D
MKYIKLFEAFDRLSRDQKSELQDYCETNLAYLMDEGFKIRIGQNIDNTTLKRRAIRNVTIQITKKDSADTSDIDREDFFWKDVKDQIIPFVLRLEKVYDIEKVRLLTEEGVYYIKSDFAKGLDEQPYQELSYMDIFLSGEKEQINESLSPKEELEDFCDTHLAYLTDEGFSIDYEELYGGHCTNVTIRHSKREDSKYSHDFSWDEIKDRFIPFIQMLSKEYELFNFHHEDYKCKTNQVVCMRRLDDLLSSDYYSYEDVVEDTIKADYLFYIKLKVGKII